MSARWWNSGITRNRFWYLLGKAIGGDLEAMAYTERLAALLARRIGLLDVIASATRHGSLDTAIRAAEHNPLVDHAARLPGLRCVAFNGAAAAKAGRKLLDASGLTLIDLPSSSPAFAAMPLARKAELWRILGDFVR